MVEFERVNLAGTETGFNSLLLIINNQKFSSGMNNHRCVVMQPCVNGDRLSWGRMAKFDPAQIRNPSTDRHKIWSKWLRPHDDPLWKIHAISADWKLLDKNQKV